MKETTRFNLVLDADDTAVLDSLAEKTRLRRTDILRMALREYATQHLGTAAYFPDAPTVELRPYSALSSLPTFDNGTAIAGGEISPLSDWQARMSQEWDLRDGIWVNKLDERIWLNNSTAERCERQNLTPSEALELATAVTEEKQP